MFQLSYEAPDPPFDNPLEAPMGAFSAALLRARNGREPRQAASPNLMVDLVHRVKVFVYRYDVRRPHYLLLRAQQGIESFWGPVHGPIEFGEQLETAIRREVMCDTGIPRPEELIDLQMPARWVLGDEEVIEWSYGFRARSEVEDLSLHERWSDFRWAEYADAYPRLELDADRAAITRLHTLLHAA